MPLVPDDCYLPSGQSDCLTRVSRMWSTGPGTTGSGRPCSSSASGGKSSSSGARRFYERVSANSGGGRFGDRRRQNYAPTI